MERIRYCACPSCQKALPETRRAGQAYCSKACAKRGNRFRREYAEAARPGVLAQAAQSVMDGMLYEEASERFGVAIGTLHAEVKRLTEGK